MDKDLKARWVAALRSGDYTQGRCRLQTDDGKFCCMGVLCKVANIPIAPNEMTDESDAESDYYPCLAAKKVGLSRKVQPGLYRMNDSEQRSFAEIADYIEREL